MKSALLFGFLGTALSFITGYRLVQLDGQTILLGIVLSNFGALFALISTLQVEKMHFFKKLPLPGPLKTWSLLTLFYLGSLAPFLIRLKEWNDFFILVLPLIWSSGFSLILFGPIQDWLVRREA